MSVKFAIAPDVDAMIDLVDSSNKVLASAESIDVITCYGEAVDQANKLGKEALEVYADMLHEKYNVPLTKSQAITLFNYANDLMEDLKKKSCLSQKQYDITELHLPTSTQEI